jgi:two-component system cell cycle sensor histidine kinase/response regulator CckA
VRLFFGVHAFIAALLQPAPALAVDPMPSPQQKVILQSFDPLVIQAQQEMLLGALLGGLATAGVLLVLAIAWGYILRRSVRQRTQALAQELANREAAEAALRTSEERFRRQFASTPVPTFVWRYADGQFTLIDANQAALDITEGKFGDIQGLAATTIYDKRPDIVERLHTCRTEQTILVYETTYHTRSTDKDLGIIFTFAYVSPDLILLHAEDVTARRRTETALNIEHANLLALIENTDGSIWSIDRNYRLIAGNAAFHQHTRVAFGREFAVGEDIFALSDTDAARDDWRDYYDRALAGEQFNVQVHRRFVEPPRWIEYRFNPIRDDAGDIAGVTVFGRDITEQKLTEATLRASEERFRLAFENANDGISLIDLDGRLLRVNKRLCEMLGYSRSELEAKNVLDVTHPDYRSDTAQYMERALQVHLDNDQFEKLYIHRDGHAVWGRVSSALVRDVNGDPLYFISHVQDITQSRQAEAALRKSQANLHALVENTDDLIASRDLAGRLVVFNSSFARLVSVLLGVEAAPGLRTMDYLLPDARSHWEEVFAEVQAGATHKEEFATVVGAETRDYEISLHPIKADGDIIGTAEFTRDITERRRGERALRSSEAALRQAQRVAQVGSWAWHIPTNRLEWSEEMHRIFGIDKATFTGDLATVIAQAIHPDDCAAVERANLAVIENQQPGAMEYRVVLPDGAVRVVWAEAGQLTFDDAGAPLLLTGIVQDITERKRAEAEHELLLAQFAQAQKMETVGRLAGGIAHDFNNMLAVILMRTEMAMQMTPPDTPLHRSLSGIYATGQRSAELVRQLLGFARKQTIAPRLLDLNPVIEGTLPMMRNLIGEDIQLNWQPGAALWTVKMDPAQVNQILANLVVNARDAITGVGNITVATDNVTMSGAEVTAVRPLPPGDYVKITVSDTGCGMDQETLARIFDPFFTTKEVGKGTGLGLATVEGIVQQNHGQIDVVSQPGVGTTFSIYVPRVAEVCEAQAVEQPKPLSQGHGETILVVEDDNAVLQMAQDALQQLGFRVIAAATPDDALRQVAERSDAIDLLMTDIVMPEMNGRDLADRVALLKPGVRQIFVSGYPDDLIAQRGVLEAGVHFLQKPYSFNALAAKVQEALQ